ncbi:FUSC family protein [Anaerococcus urinomassiliensis]|uniref:FUSC family protein n=1 Tax=Anaerococcus urinomassiliensis TaxID=1745712 RepID=UPI00093A00F7|nr:FUSC family protein [Anaerococcus urinomassiliensis]
MKFKKPGLRIVKTFIAVSLAMLISSFRPGEGLPFYSAIAAIICLKSDVEGSREIGINRVIGTILGGLCGLIFLLIVPANYLPKEVELILISLIASIIIWVMAMAGKPKAVSIMAIVFLSITINHGNEGNLPFLFAFNRTFDTMVGVISAIVVNWTDFEIRENYNHKH